MIDTLPNLLEMEVVGKRILGSFMYIGKLRRSIRMWKGNNVYRLGQCEWVERVGDLLRGERDIDLARANWLGHPCQYLPTLF